MIDEPVGRRRRVPGKLAGTPGRQPGRALAAHRGDKIVGPFEPALFDDSNGDAAITFDEITGLTVAVVRVP